MADFSHKRGKRSDESGLGSLVDFLLANARVVLGVSGAAVLAIATLAVKKLIDRATSPPDDVDEIKAKQKSLEESWQELSLIKPVPKTRREDLEEPLLSPVTAVAPQEPESLAPSPEVPLREPRPLLCSTLQEKLLSFYRDHVATPEEDKALGKQLATDICTELQNFLKNKSPELPFGTMFLCGYLCDDLASRGRLEVDFMLPLVLEPNLWRLIPGERTIINDPCFGMVKRTGVEFFPRGSSPWDRFLVGGYLSSNRVSDTLRKFLVASINWPVIGSMLECAIRPAMAPKELKLEVRSERLHLDITLRPMIEAGGKILLAASSDKPVENLWQQSFYAAAMSELKALDAADSGARRCCLGLLKVVFEGHPFWSKLAGRPLTHAVLHLSQTERDWSEAALSERVQEVLGELIQDLAKGDLPCFFDSRINLLGHLPFEEMEEIGCTLYEALAAPDLATGLGL